MKTNENHVHKYMPIALEDTSLLIIHSDMLGDLIGDLHEMAEMIDTLINIRKSEELSVKHSIKKLVKIMQTQVDNESECMAIEVTAQDIIDKWIEIIDDGEIEI